MELNGYGRIAIAGARPGKVGVGDNSNWLRANMKEHSIDKPMCQLIIEYSMWKFM
jgi:hypothetical protein